MNIDYVNFLESLSDDDILELSSKVTKFKDLKNALDVAFGIPIVQTLDKSLTEKEIPPIASQLKDGAECRILKAGSSGWRKGKIKVNISVEFIPDEYSNLESPLDEIRREMNNQ